MFFIIFSWFFIIMTRHFSFVLWWLCDVKLFKLQEFQHNAEPALSKSTRSTLLPFWHLNRRAFLFWLTDDVDFLASVEKEFLVISFSFSSITYCLLILKQLFLYSSDYIVFVRRLSMARNCVRLYLCNSLDFQALIR